MVLKRVLIQYVALFCYELSDLLIVEHLVILFIKAKKNINWVCSPFIQLFLN